MAIPVLLPVSDTPGAPSLLAFQIPGTGGGLSEAVTFTDPDTGVTVGAAVAQPASNTPAIPVRQVAPPGAVVDAAGTLTSAGTVQQTGRMLAGRVFAITDSSFKLNGGATHTARAGTGFDLSLLFAGVPVLSDPVVTWVSGSFDVSLFCLE